MFQDNITFKGRIVLCWSVSALQGGGDEKARETSCEDETGEGLSELVGVLPSSTRKWAEHN